MFAIIPAAVHADIIALYYYRHLLHDIDVSGCMHLLCIRHVPDGTVGVIVPK
jgi:hypothetical protein